MKDTLKSFIHSLGYCCPWFFFESHRKVRTGLIATRFGLSERTVRKWRAQFKCGGMKCEGSQQCLKARLKRKRR
jgi:hypothetical protein